VDEPPGLIHNLTTTPAHVHDVTEVDQWLDGKDGHVWGDPVTVKCAIVVRGRTLSDRG